MGVIQQIFKREKKEARNYRGVTLLNTAYKICASILNDKLIKELEDKLSEEQLGFRKGRGMEDAVYIMNYVGKCQKKEEKSFLSMRTSS